MDSQALHISPGVVYRPLNSSRREVSKLTAPLCAALRRVRSCSGSTMCFFFGASQSNSGKSPIVIARTAGYSLKHDNIKQALNKSRRGLFRAGEVKMRTHLASKAVTYAIHSGGTSVCRTETLI